MYDFGEVKSINDPEKLGRVKVSVYGFHDDIPHYQLEWSNVIMPANTPATLGQGHSVNLKAEVLWKTGDLLPEAITKPEEIIPGPAGQSEIIPAKIIIGITTDCIPTDNPEIITVAGPVSPDSAIFLTGFPPV